MADPPEFLIERLELPRKWIAGRTESACARRAAGKNCRHKLQRAAVEVT
jgi:hypothetical protein